MSQRHNHWHLLTQTMTLLSLALLAGSLQAQPKGTITDPIYTRTLDTVTRKPYHGEVEVSLPKLKYAEGNYSTPVYFNRSPELPGNASMVIEYVSGVLEIAKGYTPRVMIETDGSGAHAVQLVQQVHESTKAVYWVFSQPVRMYASRGSEVRILLRCAEVSGGLSGVLFVNVSGYKETLPLVVLPGTGLPFPQ